MPSVKRVRSGCVRKGGRENCWESRSAALVPAEGKRNPTAGHLYSHPNMPRLKSKYGRQRFPPDSAPGDGESGRVAADVVQQLQDRGAGREVGCAAVVDLFQHPR